MTQGEPEHQNSDEGRIDREHADEPPLPPAEVPGLRLVMLSRLIHFRPRRSHQLIEGR